MQCLPLCPVLYLYFSFAYDLSCPDPSQVHLRRKVCINGTDEDSKYACLVDTNNNNSFRESCDEGEPYLVRPGRRYVFSGSSTDESCSPNRYQPVPFSKAMFSMCILLKSTCNELGQVLSSNTSGLEHVEDSTCRCDYSTGYTYVYKPKDIYKCIPSQEDCTCYRKQCPSNGCLSSDYNCLEANVTQCFSIIDTRSESVPTTTVEMPTQLKGQIYLDHPKDVSILICLLFISALTVVVIFYRKKWQIMQSKFGSKLLSLLYPSVFTRVVQESGDHLYVKIIGHWKSLKSTMGPTELIPLLNKEGLISKQEIDEQDYKSPDEQKNYSLIKVLKACKQKKYVNKCRRIMTTQSKLDKIIRRPMQVPKWHKRGTEICRKQIKDNTDLLKKMLDPVEVMDDFIECFIFDLDQYEAIMYSDVRDKLKIFLDELDKTLTRGSFECLLTALEKSEELILSPVLVALKTGLVQASLTSGTVFNGLKNQALQNTTKVLITIKPVNMQSPESDFQNQVPKYFTYFIEEFGLYLEPVASSTDIWLYPIVTDFEERLRRGIKNGALARLIENLFTNIYEKLTQQVTLCVKVMIEFSTNNSKDNFTKGSNVHASIKQNIIAANKSLIENELDHAVFIDALVKKRFQDFKKVVNDDKQFFKLLEEKVDDKTFLKTFLKIAEDTMSADAWKKLQIYHKVWSTDSTIIPDKILENVSTLAEICTHLQDFKEICMERQILTTEFFEEIDERYEEEDKKFIEILVHIVQLGNRDAALALVETLYNKGNDLLASDILFIDNRVDTEIDERNIQVDNEQNKSGLLFEGDYSVTVMR